MKTAGWLLLLVATQAAAQEVLPDPTRPAIDLGGNGNGAAMTTQPPRNEGLQSVYISPTRRLAIINGRQFELGDRVGRAKLVEINEHSVVLQGEDGRRVMDIFPAVKKLHARAPEQENKAVTDKMPEQETGERSVLPKDGGESK